MKTKKIFAAALAGLCAVSTMGVAAFADTVETAGEKSYKISAGFQAPTIDVTVPTAIKAIINPYMISQSDTTDGDYEAEGVASPKYDIVNNSADVGIKVKATYSADGLDGIVDDAAKVVEGGKKLAYVTLNAEVGGVATNAEDEDADADTGAVSLVMGTKDTTSDLMQLKEGETGNMWIGGAVPEEPSDKWTAKDKLTINVVLDLTPYNTGATGGEGGNQGGSFTYTAPTGTTGKITGTGVTIKANSNTAYTMTAVDGDAAVTLSIPVDSDYSLSCSSSNTSVATVGASNGKVTFKGVGTTTITIEITDDNDDDNVVSTLTIDLTVAADE